MRPFVSLLPLLMITFLLLTSCVKSTAPPPAAADILTVMQTAMADTAQPLPDGLTYTRTAPSSDPAYLTDTLFSALYGEAARGLLAGDDTNGTVPAVGDVAMFLSIAPYPCELAVFRCSDIRTASTVAGLCRGRLDTVARGYAGSEWEAVAARGRVAVEGCYVFLVIAEDPGAVLERGRGMVE